MFRIREIWPNLATLAVTTPGRRVVVVRLIRSSSHRDPPKDGCAWAPPLPVFQLFIRLTVGPTQSATSRVSLGFPPGSRHVQPALCRYFARGSSLLKATGVAARAKRIDTGVTAAEPRARAAFKPTRRFGSSYVSLRKSSLLPTLERSGNGASVVR